MRRRPNGFVIGVLAISLIVLILVGTTLRPRSGVALSSENPSPAGAQAVARVLEQHGTSIERVGDLDSLRDAVTGTDTTVLLTTDALVPDDERQNFLDAVADAGGIVVVAPGPDTRTALFDADAERSRTGPVFAGAQSDGPRPVAINDPAVLTNASVDEGDNARQALTTLGERKRLVWISTWNGSEAAPEAGLDWPKWKTPLTWALALSVLFVVVIRGRRFGRLTEEPMPVTVKAIESTRALASLYVRASARDSAASALRDGTASRVGAGLGLAPARRSPDEVAGALRTRTTPTGEQSSGHDLADLLTGPVPNDDPALVELARDLDRLEKEILR